MYKKSFLFWFKNVMFAPIDPIGLGLFRILFGIVLYVQSVFVFNPEYVRTNFLNVPVHFSFYLFDFLHLPVFSTSVLKLIFLAMVVFSTAIALGFWTRFSLLIYSLCFTYIFLLEKTFYNNHYYLVILLLVILYFSGCGRWGSVDSWMDRDQKPEAVSYWPVFLLRTQIAIVFFYGAIAKMNVDWLFRAEPMHTWLSKMFPLVGYYFQDLWVAYLFSWGGMLFDLGLSILLLIRRCKWVTFFALLIFNTLNHLIFNNQIGIFPFLMIAAYILFLEPQSIRRVMHKLFKRVRPVFIADLTVENSVNKKKAIMVFVIVYLSVQLLVPLRHWLYPGNVNWNTVGERFSWRMKLNLKWYSAWVAVVDEDTGKSFVQSFPKSIEHTQSTVMTEPEMLIQYIEFLKKELLKQGISHPIIYVYSHVNLNQRGIQQIFRSDIDFAKAKYSLSEYPKWVIPLENDFSVKSFFKKIFN